jgi:hypothetical protein
MTILFTPLDIPKIIPNNWDHWWEVWNNKTDKLVKIHNNHNSGSNELWRGINLYKSSICRVTYDCPDAFDSPVVKNIVEQVFEYIPISIMCIRVIENLMNVPFHSDHTVSRQQLRAVLWSNYTDHIWNFKYNDEVRHASIPNDTNSFYYIDNPLLHSAIYDPTKSKGLLVIYGHHEFDDKLSTIAHKSSEKYKDVAWII